jgi:hypothetical protein
MAKREQKDISPTVSGEDVDVRPAAHGANAYLRSFFENTENKTSNEIATARIAGSVIQAYAKLKQSLGAQEALSFMMARELSNDRAQLERFLALALPNAPIVRALPMVRTEEPQP